MHDVQVDGLVVQTAHPLEHAAHAFCELVSIIWPAGQVVAQLSEVKDL